MGTMSAEISLKSAENFSNGGSMSDCEKQDEQRRKEFGTKLEKQAARKDSPILKVESLSALDSEGYVKAIIETPKGSRNKYDFEPTTGMFECSSALQGGMTFPFDFGFVPSTEAADGDPLDSVILMDEPAFVGCLVHVRLIGVLEAIQEEDGESFRNDRLIAVHPKSVDYGDYTHWKQLPKTFRREIEEFFILYNKCKGKKFKPLGWHGPKRALKVLESNLRMKKSA
jgi:inorganic pyrophosphatase